jgi:hypothetical protein
MGFNIWALSTDMTPAVSLFPHAKRHRCDQTGSEQRRGKSEGKQDRGREKGTNKKSIYRKARR